MALKKLMRAAAKLLKFLKLGGKYVKLFGKLSVGRLYAVMSRSRLAVLMVFYHVVYQNFDVWSSGNVERIFVSVGTVLARADREILSLTSELVGGGLGPVESVLSLLSLIGALSVLALYFRFGSIVFKRLEPTVGVVGRFGSLIVIYSLLVALVSAIEGDLRLPFQGLTVLLQNLDQVVESVGIDILLPDSGNETLGNISSNTTV